MSGLDSHELWGMTKKSLLILLAIVALLLIGCLVNRLFELSKISGLNIVITVIGGIAVLFTIAMTMWMGIVIPLSILTTIREMLEKRRAKGRAYYWVDHASVNPEQFEEEFEQIVSALGRPAGDDSEAKHLKSDLLKLKQELKQVRMRKMEEKVRVEKAMPEEETRQDPTYTVGREVSCAYYTLVIRNKALEEKYDGGLGAFVKKYECKYNADITILSAVSYGYLDEPIDDLMRNWLIGRDDFIVFDAFDFSQELSQRAKDSLFLIDLGDWLTGSYLHDDLKIIYKEPS